MITFLLSLTEAILAVFLILFILSGLLLVVKNRELKKIDLAISRDEEDTD